jgi:hypothetical protein
MTIGIFHVGGDFVVMVLGNIEDECCFSTLFIMKFKFKNSNHFDFIVNMFVQNHYSMDFFHLEMQ